MKLYGVLLAACSLAIVGCSDSSDEEQVRAVIAAGEAAAESRDASDAMKLVADDYKDDQGNDKQQLTQFLRGYLLMHPKIELLVNVGEIEFETPTRARVRLDVAMVGTQGSGAQNSLTGDYDSLQVELRKRDSEWLVSRVERVRR